jgi:peptide/nickel transport system substrate-binding protein
MKMSKAKKRAVLLLALLMAITVGLTAGPANEEADATTVEVASDQGSGRLYDTTEFYSTIEEYSKATSKTIGTFAQAPSLDGVAGLPPVKDRISEEPMVVIPLNEVGKYGGRLRLAALSPVTGSAETWTMRTQPLFIVNSDLGSVAPNVAKGWELSSDYKEITVFLRKGMKWSDGMPFTANDFVFWYEAILMNEEITPVKNSRWTDGVGVVKVEKVNDYEVKFVYPYPAPSFIDIMANANRFYFNVPFAPKHYLSQFHPGYNNKAEALAKDAGYGTWVEYFTFIYPNEVQARSVVDLPTIDTWILVKVDNNGNKFFDRNPYFWKIDTEGNQLPYIEGQDRFFIETGETINLKAVAGELDTNLQFTSVKNQPLYIENEAKGDYTTLLWQDARGSVISDFRLNLTVKNPIKKELFNNILFREAMSLAIDREAINTTVWKGLAVARQATVAPTVSVYEDWMGEYMTEYDVDGANARLDEMGLKWDAERKYRLTSDGNEVFINIEFADIEGGAMTNVVEMVAANWEAVGVIVGMKSIDQSLHFERVEANEMDVVVWNRDNNTEFGHHANPFTSLPQASEWDVWKNTKGAEGEEPSDDYFKFYELADAFTALPIGTEEYLSVGNELLTLAVSNLWHIGVAGITPKPCLISNNLGNTPVKGVLDYDYRFWMVYHPEQWYFID